MRLIELLRTVGVAKQKSGHKLNRWYSYVSLFGNACTVCEAVTILKRDVRLEMKGTSNGRLMAGTKRRFA
jgi:hypothetical protein